MEPEEVQVGLEVEIVIMPPDNKRGRKIKPVIKRGHVCWAGHKFATIQFAQYRESYSYTQMRLPSYNVKKPQKINDMARNKEENTLQGRIREERFAIVGSIQSYSMPY